MADVQTTFLDDEILDVTLAPFRDAKGKLAQVDGPPQWASSDANVISVEPSADGMSCALVSGATGQADVTISADVDLGPGTKTISYVIGGQINAAPAGEAVGFSVTLGNPRKK